MVGLKPNLRISAPQLKLRTDVMSLPKNNSSPPEAWSLGSDFVVVLAALLCALICVLGLILVARCAWIRRLASSPPATANRGLKKKVLDSLPRLTYGDELAQRLSDDCAICLAEFAAGDEVRLLPQCGHGFHVACIDTWLGSHSSCPACRRTLGAVRCKKCGELPVATCTLGGPQSEPAGGDHVDRFLP